jgi:glycosyltransferase involved in cell wall biosynthesis
MKRMESAALSDGDPRVAVAVITRNRCREVLCALGRLSELPERPQIAVVDNGSSDGTAAAIRQRFPQVELICVAENLGAGARNLAVERLPRNYVAFCDDDMWWTPGCLSRAADLLVAHPRASGRFDDYVGPILWDIVAEDWQCWPQTVTVPECARRHIDQIERIGSGIVLMHDSSEDDALRPQNRTMQMTTMLVPALKKKLRQQN